MSNETPKEAAGAAGAPAQADAEKKIARIAFGPDGTMMIVIPLPALQRPTARGVLKDADDMLVDWYHERDRIAAERAIVKPQGLMGRIGKHFQ